MFCTKTQLLNALKQQIGCTLFYYFSEHNVNLFKFVLIFAFVYFQLHHDDVFIALKEYDHLEAQNSKT